MLVYCNQGAISVLKAEDYAVYLNYVIIAQIIPASNCPPDLHNYDFKENEVLIYVPLYNTETGHFRGIKKWLRFIIGEILMKFFILTVMMSRGLRFYIPAYNNHSQIFFKVYSF